MYIEGAKFIYHYSLALHPYYRDSECIIRISHFCIHPTT